jgi:hypothetical protein
LPAEVCELEFVDKEECQRPINGCIASQFASQLPKVCDEAVQCTCQCTVGTDVNLQPTFSCPLKEIAPNK